MSDASYSFAVVCEASADQRAACGLADRVLLGEVEWLDATTLESTRQWVGTQPHTSFSRWDSVSDEFKQAGLKGAFGHFGGRPGDPDALAARKALLLIASVEPRPSAVLLVRDSDGDILRRAGLEQARADKEWPFRIILGVAEPKRECWVLVGFEPKTEEETERLIEERQRLSFDPVRDAHLLTAREHGAKKDAKKALTALTRDDSERERVCLEETPLDVLASRGSETGLTAYLREVRELLVPVLGG